MRFKIQKFYILLLVAVYSLLVTASANAATLYFSPSSGSYTVGSNFSVSVYVSSADQAMNAASGAISFPSDKLEVSSISKSGSIISLWVQEPSFSQGAVNFEGIVLNPGFIGASGKIITANFKVKAAGAASILFSSGSVLANDGKGTNILTSLGNAQFSLAGAPPAGSQTPEAITPSTVFGAPSAPQISSPTHPDPDKWYSNNNPEFNWPMPDNITAVRLLYDKFPDSKPQIVYSPSILEKQIENLNDGVYYFHAQFKNKNGWGDTAHFRFQIDTNPPKPFSIKFLEGTETGNPRPTVLFDTTDSVSGVDYYWVKIGEGDFFDLLSVIVKNNPYTLPFQSPGKRIILVQAFDKAGNFSVNTAEFTILPPPPPPSKLVKLGAEATKFLAVAMPLLALIILLITLFWYGWRKFSLLRKRIRKEVGEAESALHKTFDLLKDDMREQIEMLEKTRTRRKLTQEEEKIIERLTSHLDDAEKFIRKEIEDIEKEIK